MTPYDEIVRKHRASIREIRTQSLINEWKGHAAAAALIIFILIVAMLSYEAERRPCPTGSRSIEGWQGGRYTHLCVTGSQPFDGIEHLEVKP